MEQRLAEGFQLVAQTIRRVGVVMQMNIDVAVPGRAQLRQPIQVFEPVLILREEKHVLRAAAVAVGKRFKPQFNARQSVFKAGRTPFRFVVIAHGEEHIEFIPFPIDPWSIGDGREICRRPAIQSAFTNISPQACSDPPAGYDRQKNNDDDDGAKYLIPIEAAGQHSVGTAGAWPRGF